MKATDVPVRFNIPFGNSAGVGFIRPIPQASQIGNQTGAASLTDGFPPANFQPVAAGGVPPFGQDMNGLLKQITSWDRWMSAGAPVSFDANFSAQIGGYPKGTILASNTFSSFWLSLVDDNTTNPDAGGANWIGFKLPGQHYYIDSGSINAVAITTDPPNSADAPGDWYDIKISTTNSNAVTIRVNGRSAKAVTHPDGSTLEDSNLVAGGIYRFVTDGTTYQVMNATVARALTGGTNYYVNPNTGNDAYNGLSPSTPFRTIQKGANTIGRLDLNGYTATLNLADSAGYQESVALPDVSLNGSARIIGNNGTPTNVVNTAPAGSTFFSAGRGNCVWHISGLRCKSLAAIPNSDRGNCIWANNAAASIAVGNIDYNLIPSGASHKYASDGGVIYTEGAETISSTGDSHIDATRGGRIGSSGPTGYALTIQGTPIWISAFIYAHSFGQTGMYYSSITGAATGKRYQADNLSIIDTVVGGGANYYPGNAAGTTSGNSLYL